MPACEPILTLEVLRGDLATVRVSEAETRRLRDGQALLQVQRFGCSANNITYATLGDSFEYWKFFPAADGWGRIPAWGFASVVASASHALPEGARVFGFLPMSTHLLVSPGRLDSAGFTDTTAHRVGLAAAYNRYRNIDTDPGYEAGREAAQILLRPLFYLSFLLDDYVADSDLFGAQSVVLSSASSKAALGTAFLLARRGVAVIALTSARNVDFLKRLEVYEQIVTYDALDALPDEPTVFLDIAGSPVVRDAVHMRLGDQLQHSAVAGATRASEERRQAPTAAQTAIPGPRPVSFFAPERIRTRTRDWGGHGLDERITRAWKPFVEWCERWLTIRASEGPERVEAIYREVLAGTTAPDSAHTLSMWTG